MKIQSFSLIELIVVIAIIGVIAAVAVPIYNTYTIKAKIASLEPFRQQLINEATTYYAMHGVFPATGTGDGYGGLNNVYNLASISPYLLDYTGQMHGIARSTFNNAACPYTRITLILDGPALSNSATPLFHTTFGFTNEGDPNLLLWDTIIWADDKGVMNVYCGADSISANGNADTKFLPPACQNNALLFFIPTC